MSRRPPSSTLTATLFPYTTRFRSAGGADRAALAQLSRQDRHCGPPHRRRMGIVATRRGIVPATERVETVGGADRARRDRPGRTVLRSQGADRSRGPDPVPPAARGARSLRRIGRSEERRGGKECDRTWRSRWLQTHKKKKKK